MAIKAGSETTLDLRLSAPLREVLEQAAAHLGQSIDQFAVSVLARTAREVIEHRGETVLTDRDWRRFLDLIDDPDVEPNSSLKDAAKRYMESLD
jgi:uncharacterized protein (DUF1778 family)